MAGAKGGEEKPDLLLLTGDMPFHGSDPADWKVYFRKRRMDPGTATHLSHHRQP